MHTFQCCENTDDVTGELLSSDLYMTLEIRNHSLNFLQLKGICIISYCCSSIVIPVSRVHLLIDGSWWIFCHRPSRRSCSCRFVLFTRCVCSSLLAVAVDDITCNYHFI